MPADALWIHIEKPAPPITDLASRDKELPPLDPQESYLSAFEKSPFFGGAAPGSSVPILQASLKELVKDYRLKGVVLTDVPEAIVQDARTQKSLFIKIGDSLGELTVKEIQEGFIVLSYLGEEIRLEIL